jgi:DNA invertase Pin-like site-specific DNA recombinase
MTQLLEDSIAYYRMSSDLQDRSIPQQREWAHPAAERESLLIVAEFEDYAKSGTDTGKRNGFQKALQFCQERWKLRRPIRVIVTWNTDRFSRADSVETSWYVHEFRKVGVERMLTANGWIDFNKAEHRVLFGIGQDLTNHHYSMDIAQKSVRGRIASAREGRWNGGPVPIGYLVEYEEVMVRGKRKQRPLRLVPDPAKADVVKWLFTEYATGTKSLWQLAQELNARGIPSPGKAKFWNPTTVSVILRNEVYTGSMIWNRRRSGKFFGTIDLSPAALPRRHKAEEKVPEKDHVRKSVAHEALVSAELFAAVQKILAKRKRQTTPRHEHDFLLTGLMCCGHCGGRLLGRHKPLRGKNANGRAVKLFLCGKYARYGLRACNHNAVYEGPLFRALARKLKAELLNDETVERLRTVIPARAEAAVKNKIDNLDAARARHAELESGIGSAARKLISEDNPAVLAACREEIIRLTAERDRLAELLREAEQPSSTDQESIEAIIADALALVKRFDDALTEGEPARTRAALGELVDRIEVFFSHAQGSKGVCCTFAKALVYLRDDVPLASYFSTTDVRDCDAR